MKTQTITLEDYITHGGIAEARGIALDAEECILAVQVPTLEEALDHPEEAVDFLIEANQLRADYDTQSAKDIIAILEGRVMIVEAPHSLWLGHLNAKTIMCCHRDDPEYGLIERVSKRFKEET